MTEKQKEGKVKKAKKIIAEIHSLTIIKNDVAPAGYGNWELNKATDAMYQYIKTITNE